MKLDATGWRSRALALFAIDLRTLALFRVALAAVLACYALDRMSEIAAFFTDDGVLSRAQLLHSDAGARVSLYLVNGDVWYALLLLIATVVAATALALGFRARLASGLLFLLFISLINRNPLIVTDAETLLACLLFWALFLPLAARWSVDATLSPNPPPVQDLHLSAASTGLVVQVLSVYLFGAILRRTPDAWTGGAELAQLMAVLGPILALSPWATRPLRFAAMLGLMAMHIALLARGEPAYVSFAGLAALTVLLGGWFWDWRARVNEMRHPLGPKIFFDRDHAFGFASCRLLRTFLILPRAHIAPAQESQRAKALLSANGSWVVIDADDVAHVKGSAFVALLRPSPLFGWLWPLLRWPVLVRGGDALYDWTSRPRAALGRIAARVAWDRAADFEPGRVARSVAAFFAVSVLCWNLATIDVLPRGLLLPLEPLFRVLRIDQHWATFATLDARAEGWQVFPGRLEDGTDVDVLRPGTPLSWERPLRSAAYPDPVWQVYWWRLRDPRFQSLLPYYGDYLCREWNAGTAPGKRLLTFEMAALEKSLPASKHPTPVERRIFRLHACAAPHAQLDQRDAKDPWREPAESERRPLATP